MTRTAWSEQVGRSMRTDKVLVVIDNNSLFQALQSLGVERRLDYKKLKNWVLNQRKPLALRFYCGEVRSDWRDRRRFYDVLRRAGFEVIRIFEGKSRARNAAFAVSSSLRIQCEIAWDICDCSHTAQCDRVVLVSGSSELARVVAKARKRGLPVEVIFFEQECSPDLLRAASCFRNLRLSELNLLMDGFSCDRPSAQHISTVQ